MSSSPTDKNTMNQASKGALGVNNTLQGGAAQNTAFQNQQRNAQFGPGGSLTGMMNPSSQNVTNPQGAYATQYSNEANQVNQGTAQSLASTNRQMANQGGGLQPSGYGAAQTLSANQAGANAKANLFSQNAMASQNQNETNFWNAQNMYGQQGSQAGSQALQGLGTADSSYGSLYGIASKQKPSLLNTLGKVAAGGVGAMSTS
jgi:hypothetical protein